MKLEKYVDALPIPPVLQPESGEDGCTRYTVKMKECTRQLHRDLPPTVLWGYEGMYPGPTIKAMQHETVKIKWENHLPGSKHLLPVDTTLHGSGPDMPQVRTVVHLHGAHVDSESDGYPEAWYTRDYQIVSPGFKKKVYEYTNHQRAAILWYHDHAIGITRLNVYAGLAGFYIISDGEEQSLNLPCDAYDIPLLIQDKTLREDGSLFYPSGPANPSPGLPDPSIIPGFLGDTILVNGKVWPYLEVEPRKYRFRMLNGSNDRFYSLGLKVRDGETPPWMQIGTDGGLLEKPVKLDRLIIAPAERADVIIDFSGCKDSEIIITNTQAPFEEDTTGQIMKIKVTLPLAAEDTSIIPEVLSRIYPLSPRAALKERNMFYRVSPDQYGRPHFMLNGMMWDDPVTERPVLNSIEIWNIINSGLGVHPLHIHLIQFQILGRQPFDPELFNSTGELKFTGLPIPPDPNECGWKDTVRTLPGYVTRIIMRFTGHPGQYVWHCHILEHEDYDMMRPLKVVDGIESIYEFIRGIGHNSKVINYIDHTHSEGTAANNADHGHNVTESHGDAEQDVI